MQFWEEELLAPDSPQLLTNDAHDLRPDQETEWEDRVRPGHELSDEPAAQEQTMTRRFGIGRVVAQCGDERV
jgi:hypothetical protein